MGLEDYFEDEYYSPWTDASLEGDSESLAIFEGKKRKENQSPLSSRDDEYVIGDEEEILRSFQQSKPMKGSSGKKLKDEGKKRKRIKPQSPLGKMSMN